MVLATAHDRQRGRAEQEDRGNHGPPADDEEEPDGGQYQQERADFGAPATHSAPMTATIVRPVPIKKCDWSPVMPLIRPSTWTREYSALTTKPMTAPTSPMAIVITLDTARIRTSLARPCS